MFDYNAPKQERCSLYNGAYRIPYGIILPQVKYIVGDPMIYLQNAADTFSWKSFIGLNWPAKANGLPDTKKCFGSLSATLVWQYYMPSSKIYVPNGFQPASWQYGLDKYGNPLNSVANPLRFVPNEDDLELLNPENAPVYDQNGNPTYYEVLYNKEAYDYIVHGKLYNAEGQKEFIKKWPLNTKGLVVTKKAGDTVNIEKEKVNGAYFPVGNEIDSTFWNSDTTLLFHFPIFPGAMIVKNAYRKLTKKDDPAKYFTCKKVINNDTVLLGLVGTHIIHKVAEATQWVWTTFEHIYNCPSMDSTGVAIVDENIPYSYFDKTKKDTALYNKESRREGRVWKTVPTQVVRVNKIAASTDSINRYYHAIIRKADPHSKGLYYHLIGTQWPSNTEIFSKGKPYKPPILANSVIETFAQVSSSCMNCHSSARFIQNKDSIGFAYKYFADFLYGLNNVKERPK
jgi:hypothetical protein